MPESTVSQRLETIMTGPPSTLPTLAACLGVTKATRTRLTAAASPWIWSRGRRCCIHIGTLTTYIAG